MAISDQTKSYKKRAITIDAQTEYRGKYLRTAVNCGVMDILMAASTKG